MSFSSWITKLFTKPNKPKSQKHIPLALQSLEGRVTPALPFSTAFPTAVSIVTNTGSSGALASTSAAFTVSFSDAVTGVDSFDFSTVATGNVAVGSLEVSGSGKTYTVTAKGVTGDGQLGLNLLSNASISATASFAPQTTFGPGKIGTESVTLGDFNLDQFLDIVTTGDVGVSVYFAEGGSGSFSAPITTAVEGSGLGLALGDVTGDGFLEIIATSFDSSNNGIASVLTQTGNGAFGVQATFSVGDYPGSVTLGDVNNDGNLDIVTASTASSTASVLLGNGNGTFGAQSTFAMGVNPSSVTLGDVNGDGNLDIVGGGFIASVLLGKGNGSFAAQQTFETGNNPFSVTLGDLNGDNKLDIATGASNASVLFNNGDGTFSAPATFEISSFAQSVSLGDVNGDNHLDIVTLGGDSASILLGDGKGAFAAQTTFAVGPGVFSGALGDLDFDGKLDIVSGNGGNNSIGILKGNGNGTFENQNTFGVGIGNLSSVASGDVNGDGKVDIVTANPRSNNISVLLGNGNGSFGTLATFAAGESPYFVALGDVNGDGHLDIVTANAYSSTGSASVLLGNGDGTFAAPATFAVGIDPRSIDLGDVNGDGKLDLVATTGELAQNGTATVLLGTGNGAFSSPATFGVGLTPRSVSLGDVNGDGKLDIVTANKYGSNVSVLLGNGDGTFENQTTFAVLLRPGSVALGDVNRDGKLDIVTLNGLFSNDSINVLLGDGKGSFSAPTTFAVTGFPDSVTLGDINGDGRLDIVTQESVFLGNGDGTFGAQNTFAEGGSSATLVDVNNDGRLDIVTGNRSNNTLGVLLGNSSSSSTVQFATQSTFEVGNSPTGVALGDVNGDGKVDIVNSNFNGNTASVLLGNGNGTFESQNTFAVGTTPSSVALGDVDGDGNLDIVTADGVVSFIQTVSVLLGNGNGTFESQNTFAVEDFPTSLALGDVNGDGKLDIVTANNNGTVSVLLGNGDGIFQTQDTFATGKSPKSVSLGDVNGDGKLDIVVANGNSNYASVLLGIGNGAFATRQDFTTGSGPNSVTLGDVNGDGKLDIVTTNVANSNASVLLGKGDGTFKTHLTFALKSIPDSITLGDVNGDGKLDIVTGTFSSGVSKETCVLLGNGDGTFQPLVTFAAGDDPQSVTLGDVNNDGRLDLITGNGPDNTVSVLLNSIEFKGQVYSITNNAPPTITSGNSATFTVGQVGAFSVAANGTPTPTISTTGTLPIGVTLSPAGTLAGIPTQGGKFNFDIIATNGVTPDATQAFALIVNAAATTTGVTSSTSPSIIGESISLTAEVIAIDAGAEIPTGTVNFFSGTKDLGFGTLNIGFAAISVNNLDLGTSFITAVYNGNASFKTSTSSPLEQIVTKATSTTTLTSSPNPSVLGQSTTLTATVTSSCICSGNSPTGTVNFKNAEGVIGTTTLNANGVATISINSLQEGVVFITADYSGDGIFDSSTGFTDQSVSPFGTANALSLTTPASNAVKGKAFGVQPVVTIKDAFGNTVADSKAAVTLTASTGATLVGTATVNAVNGIATFTNVGLDGDVGNYTLTYSAGSLTQGTQSINLGSGTSPVVVGTTGGSSQGSTVSIVDPATGKVTGTVVPFPNFQGEVRVAAGDLNNDGKTETIAAAGPGGGPAVNIIDSTGKTTAAFFAYDPAFTGGCFITVSDVNNDGFADIITGAGEGGGPHVKIFNGKDLSVMGSFFAYAEDFRGGVSVASADINGDGILDVVTGAGPGGGPHVKVFDGKTNSLISQWFAYSSDFTGGVFVAIGDIGNDGKFEVVTGAGVGGGPVVAVFDPFTGALQAQFFAYGESFTGGVRVGVSDGNSDGVADLVTGAGPGGGPHVKGFNFPALDLLFEFFSGPADDKEGVFVG